MKYIVLYICLLSFSCSKLNNNLEGVWGDEARFNTMTVGPKEVNFEFACAAAVISESLPDDKTKFVMKGTYIVQHPVEYIDNDPNDFKKAVINFTRSGDKMDVVIEEESTGIILSINTFKWNSNVHVFKCN